MSEIVEQKYWGKEDDYDSRSDDDNSDDDDRTGGNDKGSDGDLDITPRTVEPVSNHEKVCSFSLCINEY